MHYPPYERFLTSGAALLAMSFGKIIIGPKTPQFLEILPASSQRYLYNEGDNGDMKRAVLDVLNMSREEHSRVASDLLERAEYFSPERISSQLGSILHSFVAPQRAKLLAADAAKRENKPEAKLELKSKKAKTLRSQLYAAFRSFSRNRIWRL
ncbi:hypothetical protein AJ87_24240 [Rhizobium yanglingense]|nr:hypothetical protein AJ87_24240 [Rhizobium yanglingense]